MAKDSLFSIASLAVNQMIVIDKNGDLKIATIGEKLPEGSVVIQRGDEAGFNNEPTTQLVGQNNELQDVTDDVAQLIAALEEGQDPTQIDEELAPAAGSSLGSSPTDSASIERAGPEIIARTDFSTSGFESIGFSQTQSLALINLNRSNSNATTEAEDKNSAPKAQNDTISVDEDTTVTIDVLSNDTDKDGDLLTIESATVPQEQGTVVIVDGKLVFTPAENYNGKANIEYTISDGQGGIDTAKVTVTVNPVNDDPVANNDAISTDEDTPVSNINVLANDRDVDGDPLSVTAANAEHGSVTINADGTLNYTPNGDYNGSDTITYTVSDGQGGTDTAKVTVTVNPVNDAPIAVDDTYSSSQETILFTESFENMASLSSGHWMILSNSELEATSAWQSNHGLEIQANGVVTNASDGKYYAELDANINTSIKTTIDTTGQDSVRIEFDYNPRHDGNSSSNMTFAVGTVLVFVSADGTVSTSDEGVSVSIQGPDSDGWYHISGNFPSSEDGSTDLILSGSGNSDSYGALVDNIVVTGVVDADLVTTEDTALTINVSDLLANDSDPDGDTISITLVSTTSEHNGTVTLVNGTIVYQPNSNFSGVDSFTYSISDGKGGVDTATVTVNVIPENDPPVADDDKGTVTEEQTSVTGNVLDNDTDVDTPHEELKVTSVNYGGVDYPIDENTGAVITTPSGTLTINSDGSYTFEVSADANSDAGNEESNGKLLNGIAMYGVNSGDLSVVEDYIANLEDNAGNTNSNGAGTGVGSGNGSKLSEGESLIVDFGGSVSAATISLNQATSSEIVISVYDSDGNLLKNDIDYTYVPDSDDSGVTATITTSNYSEIGYVVLGVHHDGKGNNIDFYRVVGVTSATFIDSGTDSESRNDFEEQFTYTVEDGDGGSDTATLTINGEYPVDDAPVITFESGQDSVVVSEEGLSALSANPDSEGTSDTTNDSIAQGTFAVSDVDTDSSDLSVSLIAPDVALYSNNVAIEWSTENGNLVGKAGNETILVISLSQDSSNPSSYSYTVTLLGSLDHSDKTAEDTLSFDVGVEVSDGTNTVKDSITVTVEDDSPDVPVNIVVDAVEHNETTTVSLGDFNFTQRPNDSGCHNNNAYTFIDTNSGNSVFVYAVGLLGTHHEELTFSNDSGMGVKSSSVFGVINDRTDGEIDYQYGNSEKIVMELGNKVAYGMQVSLAEFYSNEGEKGKIIFLLGGKVVQEEDLIATHSNGNYSASFNVASGFDEVRFEAVTNGNGWCSDNSDYSIKSVSFESLIVDPVIATDEGTITADFGADGAGVITLTGVADTNIKTADGLPVTLGSTDVVDGVKTQVWVDSHGDKVFEIELNSSTGEWSYRQFAELAKGDSVEITYDIVDADGDIVSSTSPNTGTDNDFTSGLKGEFYNVGYQLGTIAQAVYVTEHQNANATFTSYEISYIGQDWDDLGDYDWWNESTNLESWLGDDAQSVEFKNKTDSNDAVVRLTGGVALDAGTYSIKVNADDGYRIIIDGHTVASFDSNTSVRSEEFIFSVDENGIHQIEVIYWDQGGAYVLEVSLNDGSGYELLGSEAYPTYSDYNVEVTDYVNSVGTSNNDHLVGTAVNDHIQGLGAQDHLFGGAGDDWLEGGEGDDHLISGSGNDILDGGSGQDSLSGGSGDDKLYGQQGDDLLSGESGNDYLDGGQGQDYLYGGLGNDILVGGDGDDKLFGEAGDDVLIGGNGHDQLTGGSGSDVFVIEGSNSSDTIMDFNVQEDIVDISELLNIDSSNEHDAIQAYLNSDSSSLFITANGDGSATISVADQNSALHSAGSFGADSHIVSGDIVSVLFNNQEYTLKVD
ncbi:tandem-95 repeat protein [Vibrio sp. Y2-5]|uniref:tandem-95 repeat protein n=1 Tax=Vibrio sp. Y2-5 TaxID=2743977 RepID=UPI001660B923|nr:tandem-95 repeat protein [Vibrio sp. Y2-5]MBD0786806.1 tandem-95 repeat protein [Vibrio sp. Y2-5]